MIGTTEQSLVSLLLVVTVVSCGDAAEEGDRTAAAESDFRAFASELFDEMSKEPLDATFETETGLFGDMSVTPGELVVMGRYRFRVDSSSSRHVGHMAFQIRDAERMYKPVPVVLRFVSLDGTWRLDEAAVHTPGTASPPDSRNSAGQVSADSRPNPLGQSVMENLNPWVDAAVERVDAS